MSKCVRCQGTGVVTWVQGNKKADLGCKECNGTGRTSNTLWINFNERKPMSSGEFLIIDNANNYHIDFYDMEKQGFTSFHALYWTPIPDAPNDIYWRHGSELPEVDGEYFTISKDEREVKIKEFSSRTGWSSYSTIKYWSEIPE